MPKRTHYKFTNISGLHQVLKIKRKHLDKLPLIEYKCKVKLHGTNAAVVVTRDDDVYAQSRTSVKVDGPTNSNSHFGFTPFVEKYKELFLSAKSLDKECVARIFYGEWCGPGIQKGVAISSIPEKQFCIFAMKEIYDSDGSDDSEGSSDSDYGNVYIVDPEEIKSSWHGHDYGKVEDNPVIKFIPFYNLTVELKLNDKVQMKPFVDEINRHIESIDGADPWVKSEWNVDGHGEGLVFYPCSLADTVIVDNETVKVAIPSHYFNRYTFKAKGEKHKVVGKRKAPVQMSPEKLASVKEFSDMFVTKNRMNQMVTDNELDFDVKNTGKFLKTIIADIYKESKAELEANNLEWHEAMGICQGNARNWWLNKCKEI